MQDEDLHLTKDIKFTCTNYIMTGILYTPTDISRDVEGEEEEIDCVQGGPSKLRI